MTHEAETDAPASPVRAFTMHIPLPLLKRWGVFLILACAVLFSLIQLYPEVGRDVPPLNDSVLHLINVRRAAEAMAQGQDPTDPWLPQVVLGYPLFRYYQHLGHQIPALAVALSGGALSPEKALAWTVYLLFSLLPLPLYGSARRLGLDRLAALGAAAVGSLLATDSLYGVEAMSFVWGGYGLYTRLWAAWLFPLAFAQTHVTLRTGQGYLLSVVLVAGLLLCQMPYAYILILSLAVLALVGAWQPGARKANRPDGSLEQRLWRLFVVLALAGVVASYYLIPFLLGGAYTNPIVMAIPWKHEASGAGWVLSSLVKGELFDAGRFPSLTLLAGLGFAICAWRWRQASYRALGLMALFWLLLFFGQPTWGTLLSLLPMSGSIDFHRRIGALHLGGIYLMGIALAWPWRWAMARAKRRYLLAPAALTLTALLLLPVYRERIAFHAQEAAWIQETADAFAAEQADLDALVDAIQEHGPGRVYAGLPATWGGEGKIGAVPLYAYLNGKGLDTVGFLYHALSLNSPILLLFDDAILEQYQLFNVRYVVTPTDWLVPDFYHTLGDYGRFRLYEIPSGGYFDLVDSDMAFVGANTELYPAASAWLYSSLLAAKQHPTIALGAAPLGYPKLYPLDEAAAEIPLMQPSPGAERGQILSQAVGSNWFQADALIQRDCWLMLKVTYHPGWRAYVDGAPAETVMLMPSYVGVRLAPGQHTVRLEYSGGAGRLALMGLGALTLALLAQAERRPDLAARLHGWILGRHRSYRRRR